MIIFCIDPASLEGCCTYTPHTSPFTKSARFVNGLICTLRTSVVSTELLVFRDVRKFFSSPSVSSFSSIVSVCSTYRKLATSRTEKVGFACTASLHISKDGSTKNFLNIWECLGL